MQRNKQQLSIIEKRHDKCKFLFFGVCIIYQIREKFIMKEKKLSKLRKQNCYFYSRFWLFLKTLVYLMISKGKN